nr:50S ribosomal protein L21 [Ornithinimicrobium cryptoxanthini]
MNVYAIVRAGGRQEKVSVGDVLIIDKVSGQAGDAVELTPLMVVDGTTVTTDGDALAKVKVSAEVVKAAKGPKIVIQKYKNKTGYKKRQGHRQPLTQVKITAIDA